MHFGVKFILFVLITSQASLLSIECRPPRWNITEPWTNNFKHRTNYFEPKGDYSQGGKKHSV